MTLQERIPIDDLAIGLVTLDPLLFLLQFWGPDVTMEDGHQDLSIEQRLMLCDQSERVLLCTGRKVAKTLSLERDFVQIGLTNQKRGTLDEGLFFTPALAHMDPVRDRIFSRIFQEPLFSEMVERTSGGHMMMSKGDGYVTFKTSWKWHCRIEGQCLAPETRVMDATTGALYSMEDIYHGCRPNEIYTFCPEDSTIRRTDNFSIRHNGKRDIYSLTLRSGQYIKATANHKFMTPDGWKRLDEIAPGEYVMLPGSLSPDNKESGLTIEEAALLGYFIGDGGTTRGTPSFTNSDLEIVEDFTRCCNVLGVSVREDGRYGYTITNGNSGGKWSPNPVTELLRKHGVWDHLAHEKTIPPAIFCSDNDTVAAFVSALWSCDGSAFVSPNDSSYVEYYSSSEQLIRDFSMLMLRFGIHGNIIRRRTAGDTHFLFGRQMTVRQDMWVWRSGAVSDIVAFCRIAKTHGRKQVQLDTISANVVGRPVAFKSDGVPTTLVRRIIREQWDGSVASLCRQVGYVVGTKTYKTHALEKVAKLNRVLNNRELAACLDGTVLWSEVASIEFDRVDDTYDLNVPDTHCFFADGILVHNTGTDVNMVGLRCKRIIGDELAFGSDVCHKSRINTALPGCKWKYCGVPNGVRGTPFWRLDQTQEGASWSRHKMPQFDNPIYAPESERRKLIADHGGEYTHSYITQVLGEWGDEVMSTFPPGTLSTYDDRDYHLYDWGSGFGEKSNFRDDVLDTLFRLMNYPTTRCVIGWDYGVSPDPAVFSLLFEEEPGEWYLRAMFVLRGVQFPHQIKFVTQIADRFTVAMVCTDEATAVQSLAHLTGFTTYNEDTQEGNVMWSNVNGRIELLDAKGNVVLDELGAPIKEYRKKWATDELRNGMVHAREDLHYPYHFYLPEETKDAYLIDELVGTVEKRTQGGYTQYLTAKQTEGSKSPDDHRTDSLRYAVLCVYSLLGAKATNRRAPFSEYQKVMGWRGKNRDWKPPWSH